MSKPKTEYKCFAGTNYVKLRTEIQKWLEENPGIEVIDIHEGRRRIGESRNYYRAIGIVYYHPR